MVTFKEIIGVFMTNRDPVIAVPINRIIPENAVLYAPAQENAISLVVMADAVFNY